MARVKLGDVDNVVKKERTKARVKKVLKAMPEVDEVIDFDNLPKETKKAITKASNYEDTEDEFGEEFGVSVTQDSDLRHVLKDFSSPDGIEANTDLTEIQAEMILNAKLYANAYPDLPYNEFSKWFNTIRLSVHGKNALRKVEVLKGNVTLQPNDPNAGPRPPSRGF